MVRFDVRAGDHIDLVLLGDGNQRIGGGDPGLFQRGRTVSVGKDDGAVDAVARLPHAIGVLVDQHDVTALRNQRPSQLHADKTSANDNDLHEGIIAYLGSSLLWRAHLWRTILIRRP